MNTHGRTWSGRAASIARRGAAHLSSVLLQVAGATMAPILALCLVQPVGAQSPGALVIPYTGTLKKINDSGDIRIGYRENSPPFAFLDARRNPHGLFARPVRNRGRGDRGGARQGLRAWYGGR